MQIIGIKEQPKWLLRAAKYFSHRWKIDEQLYIDSMNESLSAKNSVPRWYLMLRGDEIIGGCGLIDNDFMVREDLCPWLCALYIEPDARGQQLGAKLLEYARREAAALGYGKVYLNTDHVGYYEKYGWRYMGSFAHSSGEDTRVYEANTPRIEISQLILRPLTEADVATVLSINADEYQTEKAAIEFIRWQNNPGRLLIQFYIWLKQANQCIGRVYIHAKPEIDNEVEIGYSILEAYRNLGYATQAAKAAVWYAFEQAGQEVLTAIVSAENIASRRVIEKLGFINGGTRMVYHDGENREFDYYRLYNTDPLPNPEWNIESLYKPEKMADFFNLRAGEYNDHMLAMCGEEDYRKLGQSFPKTEEAIAVLNLGCGTGMELYYIWMQAPNAHITCMDVSRGMLDLLLANHPEKYGQIAVVQASYLNWMYPQEAFDIVVSNMTMHHLWPEEKIEVYRKIFGALKPGGLYIEGDFIVNALMAEQYRRRYAIIAANLPHKAKAGEYHIDIPCTVEAQQALLCTAGFGVVELLDDEINRGNGALLRAKK